MRRNYASLDLQALRASSTADEPDDVDLTTLDADAAALFADVLGHADDGADLQAVAQLSLDDPRGSIGCPLEMMADGSAIQDDRQPRPTSPSAAVPIKTATLPVIRPSANDPVRRSVLDFAPSSPSIASSPYASTSKKLLSTSASASPIISHATPLVALHRNVIQSV
jgi:hypothetical protein